MTSGGSLDVCVLADPYLREWEVRSIEYAVDHANATLSLVVVDEPTDSDIDPDALAAATNDGFGIETVALFRQVLEREGAWSLVIAERELAKRLGDELHLRTRRSVRDVACFESADVRRVTPISDGNWNELPLETVREIGERCDVAIRYGFGLLRGGVLDAPTHGVLSFHPADIRRYRGLGTPMAYLDGRETIGVTLQRLTEDVDAGEIVAEAKVDVTDCSTLWDVYERIHERQLTLVAEGIDNLADPTFEPTVPESLGLYNSMQRRREPRFALRTLVQNLRGRLS